MKKLLLVASLVVVASAAFSQEGFPSIDEMNQMISQNPSARNFLARGRWYASLDMYQEALSDFNRALVLEPQNPDIYHDRSVVFMELGDYQRCFRDIDRCIELDPLSPENYVTRGIFFLFSGQFADALKDFDKALSFNRQNENALRWRGSLYQEMERHEEAVSDFTEAISLKPQEMENYDLRSMSYEELGKFNEAVIDLTICIENGDEAFLKSSKVHKGRAQVYLKLAAGTSDVRRKAEYERLAEEGTLEKLTGSRE